MAEQCTVRSPAGVVAAAAPVAARVGASFLAAGGNAFDAVIGAALAETVLLPPKCGIAGDLVALAWSPTEAAPRALLAIGGAPAGLAAVAERAELSATGPGAVGVPGAPAGYAALAERSAFDLQRLAEPAVGLAREGFAWSPICTVLSEESHDLVAKHNPAGTSYFPGGRPIPPGSVTTLPGLGDAITRLAADPLGFLVGPVGEAIVARVRDAGGVLTADDMRYSTAEWASVCSTEGPLGRYFATPAPTHGPSLLEVVEGLGSGLISQGELYRSALTAIARRRAALADPSGTSMVSAVDRDRTMVTVVHSNSFPRYGSGLIVDEFDLILSNRAGRGFTPEPSHPNFPVAGRRPATTLHAWAVAEPGGRRLQGATPGGANQMPWNAQALARLAADPSGVGHAVVDARWEWRPDDDGVRIEAGMPEADVDSLAATAPAVERVERWELRSAMQLLTDPGDGEALTATVDPRTGGGVVAL